MIKKSYLLAGAAAIIIAVAVGIYWYSQSPKMAPLSETEELAQETENLSQDVSDLETAVEDKDLDTLEEDLSAVAEETPLEQELPSTPTVDVNAIENLESELSAELDGLSNDLTDLGEFGEDASLDNLDTSLSNFTE